MRLIDADALPITPVDITDLPKDGTALIVYSKENVDNAPTVDTERHGHWVKENEEDTLFCVYKCSLCAGMVLTDRVHLFKYCPYCGAKMDEVDNNGEMDKT